MSSYNIEARKIFLNDAYERVTTGYSPLNNNIELSKKYKIIQRLFYLSCISNLAFFFLVINKWRTRRTIYPICFGLTCVSSGFLNKNYQNYQEKLLKEYNVPKKYLEEYANFYFYSLNDAENLYEKKQRRKLFKDMNNNIS